MISPGSRSHGALVAVILVGLSGCAGSPTNPANQLSGAELADFVDALAVLSELGLVLAPRRAPMGPAPHTIVQRPTPVACPQGGEVVFRGSIEFEEATGSFLTDFVQTVDRCSVAPPGSAGTFVFDGTLSYDLFFEVISEVAASISLSQTGTLSWSADEESGRCQVAIDVEATVSPITGEGTGTVVGVVCGEEVSRPLNLLGSTS